MYIFWLQNASPVSHKNTASPELFPPIRNFLLACGLLSFSQTSCFATLRIQGGGMKDEQVRELLYQALETEIGGVDIYTTALRCVENEELKEEWEEYLEQTENHVKVMEDVLTKLELDPD